MSKPADVEARLSALETRIGQVAAEAAAAGHLADLGVKVDANRSAINALGVQTSARFDRLDDGMRSGFTEMRGKVDQSTAGQQQIVELLTGQGDQ